MPVAAGMRTTEPPPTHQHRVHPRIQRMRAPTDHFATGTPGAFTVFSQPGQSYVARQPDCSQFPYVAAPAHAAVEAIAPTKTLDEWTEATRSLSQALRSLGLPGCCGPDQAQVPYVLGSLCRTLLLLRNEVSGVGEVSIDTARCGTLRTATPDTRSYVQVLAEAVAAMPSKRGRVPVRCWEELPVGALFEALDYHGRPECFSMYACFFGQCLEFFNTRGLDGEVWLRKHLPRLLLLKHSLRERHGAIPQAPRLLQELYHCTTPPPPPPPAEATATTATAVATSATTTTATTIVHRHHPTTAPPPPPRPRQPPPPPAAVAGTGGAVVVVVAEVVVVSWWFLGPPS